MRYHLPNFGFMQIWLRLAEWGHSKQTQQHWHWSLILLLLVLRTNICIYWIFNNKHIRCDFLSWLTLQKLVLWHVEVLRGLEFGTRFGIFWMVIGQLGMRKDDLRHLAFDPLNFMSGKLRKKSKTTLRREFHVTFQETRRKILGGQKWYLTCSN